MLLDKKKVVRKMEEKAATARGIALEHDIAYNAVLNARNGRPVKAATVQKLCKALGCEPIDLLPDEE